MSCALSIVVPCFNEQDGLPHLANKLENALRALSPRGDSECLFVDDGSLDGTFEGLRVLSARFPRSRILRHAARRGVGAAMRTGFGEADGDVVLTMDADCTYDPAHFSRMLADMDETGADIVTASPYHPQGRVVGVPAWRIFLSKTLSRVYAALLPVKLHTYTALFRAQKKRAVKQVTFLSDGFLGVTEFLIRAIQSGFSVVETPLVLEKRIYGASKLKTLPVIREHLGVIARLVARKKL